MYHSHTQLQSARWCQWKQLFQLFYNGLQHKSHRHSSCCLFDSGSTRFTRVVFYFSIITISLPPFSDVHAHSHQLTLPQASIVRPNDDDSEAAELSLSSGPTLFCRRPHKESNTALLGWQPSVLPPCHLNTNQTVTFSLASWHIHIYKDKKTKQ